MKRRPLLLGLPLALAGCGLDVRPYAEQRQWPLQVPRPVALPPRAGGKVLEVRDLRAGPGLDSVGLQAVRADGSIETSFYEQWAVPPAQGVEDALRLWLAQCGQFAAVVAPGTRAIPDLSLNGELTALWTDEAGHRARAAVAVTVVDVHSPARGILLQQTFSATAPVTVTMPPAAVQAQLAALADVFAQIEAAMVQKAA
jgi:ABC-type uncharacterized transport system auxiliary subunit